jgi:hypothetical protein
MKVTMLTKRISTNVIASTPDAALTLLLTQDECKDFSVLNVQVSVITAPDAVKKTIEFAEASGIYVIGHYPGMQVVDPNLKVWSVTADLEYAVDFTMPAPAATDGQGLPQEGLRQAAARPQDNGRLGRPPGLRSVVPSGRGRTGSWTVPRQSRGLPGTPGLRPVARTWRAGGHHRQQPSRSGGSDQEAAPDMSTTLQPGVRVMPRADRKLTIAYIDSPECDWPATVKERAKEIIRLTAELSFEKARVSQMDMLDRSQGRCAQQGRPDASTACQCLPQPVQGAGISPVPHQSLITRGN